MARYDSFLLRIWRSTRQDGVQCALRLEHLQSGESFHCTDLAHLHAHLESLLATPAAEPPLPERADQR